MTNLRSMARGFKTRFARNKTSRLDSSVEMEDFNPPLGEHILPRDLQRTDTMFPNLSGLNWMLERALGGTASLSPKKKSKNAGSGPFAEGSESGTLRRGTSIDSIFSLASTTTSAGSSPKSSVPVADTVPVSTVRLVKCHSPKSSSGPAVDITETTPLNALNASSALEAGKGPLVRPSFRKMPWTATASFVRSKRGTTASNILRPLLACVSLTATYTLFTTVFYLSTIGTDFTKYLDWIPWSLGTSAALCIFFLVASWVRYLVERDEGCSWKTASWETFKAVELFILSIGLVMVTCGGLMFLYMKTGWGR